ncbi:hypothetical protein [Nonomuraea phyllanthi]|nr:hypothetical protein [Nonomuraea phyllanthi]
MKGRARPVTSAAVGCCPRASDDAREFGLRGLLDGIEAALDRGTA